MPSLAEIRKFLAALTGGVAVAVSAGLISGTAQRWTTGILAVGTAIVVYYVRNADPKPKPEVPVAIDAG